MCDPSEPGPRALYACSRCGATGERGAFRPSEAPAAPFCPCGGATRYVGEEAAVMGARGLSVRWERADDGRVVLVPTDPGPSSGDTQEDLVAAVLAGEPFHVIDGPNRCDLRAALVKVADALASERPGCAVMIVTSDPDAVGVALDAVAGLRRTRLTGMWMATAGSRVHVVRPQSAEGVVAHAVLVDDLDTMPHGAMQTANGRARVPAMDRAGCIRAPAVVFAGAFSATGRAGWVTAMRRAGARAWQLTRADNTNLAPKAPGLSVRLDSEDRVGLVWDRAAALPPEPMAHLRALVNDVRFQTLATGHAQVEISADTCDDTALALGYAATTTAPSEGVEVNIRVGIDPDVLAKYRPAFAASAARAIADGRAWARRPLAEAARAQTDAMMKATAAKVGACESTQEFYDKIVSALGFGDAKPWWHRPTWVRPPEGGERTAAAGGELRFIVQNVGGRLVYRWPLPCPRVPQGQVGGTRFYSDGRPMLRGEYRRLAAAAVEVDHVPALSPTALAALGGNRNIGRDFAWDDPDEVGT